MRKDRWLFMKEAFKKRKVIILSAILCFLILIFFAVSIVLEQIYVKELPYNLPVVLVFLLVVFLLIAFVAGDLSSTRYRRSKKLWAGALPKEVKQRVWDLRTPWLTASIFVVIIAIIDTIIWR